MDHSASSTIMPADGNLRVKTMDHSASSTIMPADGHLRVKLGHGREWRATSIINDELSMQDLALMAQRLFPSALEVWAAGM